MLLLKSIALWFQPNMLYPVITFDPVVAAVNPNSLPSGTLALVVIDMTSVLMTQIYVSQVSLTEDFCMRGWVSEQPAGISIIFPFPDMFPLVRMTPRPLVIYVHGQTPPINNILAPVTPGLYYLNILNLTNSPAMFAFSQITLA